ncbi:MAG: Crp/Fnr family transcriptional regulator [Sphingobacteriales bacterium]|nr:MAG: Crp/Fnr family transcriptional regulator [Sphingobacteriales bacterium]
MLDRYFKPISVSKKTILKTENNVARKLYFVVNGFLKTSRPDRNGNVTIQIASSGDFITVFESFVNDLASNEVIECISDCELMVITKTDYLALTAQSHIWEHFCKKVYEKLIADTLERTRDLLTMSATDRYLKLLKAKPDLIKNVPIHLIASYIGIKPESLSRLRRNAFPNNC